MSDTDTRKAVLEFRDVSVSRQPPYDAGIEGVSFALGPGELALVRVEDGYPYIPLCDAALGLAELDAGKVLFDGANWAGLNGDEAVAARVRIGRVFEQDGWISNLDVDENIMLGRLSHTTAPESEILASARQVAREFGMESLPAGRPATVPRFELRRAQWVRAFLSQPVLLLLERPTWEMPETWIDTLLKKVAEFRARGAACLWVTGGRNDWNHAAINPTLKFQMRGSKMVPVELGNQQPAPST